MSKTPNELAEEFAELFQRKFPDLRNLTIDWDRHIPARDVHVTIRPGPAPEKAPLAPVLALKPEAAPSDPPEPQGPDEAQGRHVRGLPDAGKPTNSIRFAPATIAEAKMLLERGMRGTAVARKFGMSQSYASKLKLDQARRDVEPAPDPRWGA